MSGKRRACPTKEGNLADESFRHCNSIDLKGRLAGNFCGARNSSSSLFASFFGFGFGFGRFLLLGRLRCDVVAFEDNALLQAAVVPGGTKIELGVGRLRVVIKAGGGGPRGAVQNCS